MRESVVQRVARPRHRTALTAGFRRGFAVAAALVLVVMVVVVGVSCHGAVVGWCRPGSTGRLDRHGEAVVCVTGVGGVAVEWGVVMIMVDPGLSGRVRCRGWNRHGPRGINSLGATARVIVW